MAPKELEEEGLLQPPSPLPAGEDGLTDDEASTLAQDEEEVLQDDYESGQEETSKGPLSGGILDRFFKRRQNGPEYHRPSRRHRERRRRGEVQAETMYEMEEGGEASMSSASSNISEDDVRAMKESSRKKRGGRSKNRFGNVCCHIAIVVFFLGLLVGAFTMTKKSKAQRKPVQLVSNGTSLFAPTTLLISLDGFRADFLQRGLTPTLDGFIREGVSPLYMMPPFPSVTFVSHYTMATGLFPEEHGIVGNSFWEPDMKEEFFYTDPKHSMEPKWWGGEPFWVTAEKQGAKAAIHMYPGSEAHIGGVDLTYVDQFKHDEPLENKAKRVLGWLDYPGPTSPETIADSPRPQLLVAYVPDVDSDGHLYGPNSTEISSTIKRADDMLTIIFDGLRQRNLTDIVNVVIVSDHGMATTSVNRLIQLDDLIDLDKIEHIDGWPLYGLRPKRDEDIEPLYYQLKDHAKNNPNFEVYLRDKDMPPEYHFSKNPRIAPLWIVPKTGWAIAKKSEFDVKKAQKEGLVFNPRGIHGYDYRVS
jgi:predicted AlkP superfamily pyrophosphatase or phosphodiesterase